MQLGSIQYVTVATLRLETLPFRISHAPAHREEDKYLYNGVLKSNTRMLYYHNGAF